MSAKKKQPYVIVRTYSAGVHAGNLVLRKGKECVLSNTRRLWYWKGAASLSELALSGVKFPLQCKFSVAISENTLTEGIEFLKCSKEAEVNIKAVPEWKA
jgi:hypothetical protein